MARQPCACWPPPAGKRQPGYSHVKAWWQVVRTCPSVLLAPALVLIAGITVGCVVVDLMADIQRDTAKANAQYLAGQIAANMRRQILSLLYPVAAVSSFLQAGWGHNYTVVKQMFPLLAERLLSQLDQHNPHIQLQLAPQAYLTDVYPLNDFSRTGLGLDFLKDPYLMDAVMPLLHRTDLIIQGPVYFAEGYLGITGFNMVYMSNVSQDFNFSQPVPTSPNCPPRVCYNETTRTKFWGMVASIVPLDTLIDENSPMQALRTQGYDFLVTQPSVNLPPSPGQGNNTILVKVGDSFCHHPVSVQMTLESDIADASLMPPWTLHVAPSGGWRIPWEAPMYVVVVVISLALSVLLLALMVSRLENQTLLYSLVPERMVKELKARRMSNQAPPDAFEMSTPAEVLLEVLSGCMVGMVPHPATCAQLRGVLLSLQDIYRPVNLTEQIKAARLDDDVARSLMATLGSRDVSTVTGNWDELRRDQRLREAAEYGKALSASNSVADAPLVVVSEPVQDAAEDCRSTFTDLQMAISVLAEGLWSAHSVAPPYCLPQSKPGSGVVHQLPQMHQRQPYGPSKLSLSSGRRRTAPDLFNTPPGSSELRSSNAPSPSNSMRRPSLASYVISKVATAFGSPGEGSANDLRGGGYTPGALTPGGTGGGAGAVNTACAGVCAPGGSGVPSTGLTQGHGAVQIHVEIGPTLPPYDELRAILDSGYYSWTFDAFALDAASNGHPLSTLMFYLIHQTGLMDRLQLPASKVAGFLQTLELLYWDNPYHNRTHAADVAQTMHVLLSRGGFLQSYCDPIRHLACLLAAAAHDVEHVGLTNDFLVNTDDRLALRYNDRSPMENHHLATFFHLLRQPRFNFIAHLSKDVQKLIRKVIIELVLATDMTQHLTILSQFKSVHQANLVAAEASPRTSESSVSKEACTLVSSPVFQDEKERLLALQMLVKVADLGSLAETTEVHCRWVEGLTEEFFQQGDKEREAGLPISPLFDRNLRSRLPQSQVGFYSFVAMPLFTAFTAAFPATQPFLDRAKVNYRYWQEASTTTPAPGNTDCSSAGPSTAGAATTSEAPVQAQVTLTLQPSHREQQPDEE